MDTLKAFRRVEEAIFEMKQRGIEVHWLSATAHYEPDTAIASIGWSMPEWGNGKKSILDGGVSLMEMSKPPDTIVRFDLPMDAVALNELFMRYAWLVGAYDIRRLEHKPSPRKSIDCSAIELRMDSSSKEKSRGGDDLKLESVGLRIDYGHHPYSIGGIPFAIGEGASEETMVRANEIGYAHWTMIPNCYRKEIWRKHNDDPTLTAEGRRTGEIPRIEPLNGPLPVDYRADMHELIYRLGEKPRKKSHLGRSMIGL